MGGEEGIVQKSAEIKDLRQCHPEVLFVPRAGFAGIRAVILVFASRVLIRFEILDKVAEGLDRFAAINFLAEFGHARDAFEIPHGNPSHGIKDRTLVAVEEFKF